MKQIFYILIVIFQLQLNAQENLVPNPSFEEFTKCPSKKNKCTSLKYWFLNNPKQKLLYLNTCSNKECNPINNDFGNQSPRTDNGMVGILVRDGDGYETGNLLQIKLEKKLEKHQKYLIQFYVSLADNSELLSDNIGCMISKEPIPPIDYLIENSIEFRPQIYNQEGSFIEDKDSWVKVSGTFISNGEEQYLNIGEFYIGGIKNSQYNSNLMFFIDDVSVVKISMNENNDEKENLISNGGFEELYYCPLRNTSNFDAVYKWNESDTIIDGVLRFEELSENEYQKVNAVDILWGSADIYCLCNRDTFDSVHSFPIGVKAIEGVNFAGINLAILKGHQKQRGREYIQIPIKNKLVKGKKYKVSMNVRLSYYSNYASSTLGVLFSDKRLFHSLKDYKPINGYSTLSFENSIIKEKDNWIRIEDEFIANGDEKYMTIGDFDKKGTEAQFERVYDNGENISYYLIDNVKLIELKK